MDIQGEGITTAQRRFDLRRWQKVASLGVAGVGLSLLLATGALAAPPSTPNPATPVTQPASGTPVAPGQDTNPMPPAGGPAGDGNVTAVSGNTITVQGGGPAGDGTTKTITVNGGTAYFIGGPDTFKAGSLSDVKVGSRLHAEGSVDGSGNLTAIIVRVETPKAGGEVTTVVGDTITVQEMGPASAGATRTITVSATTVYAIGTPETTTVGSLADVKAGVHVHAEGILNSDGSFSATTVRIDLPPTSTSTVPAPPAPGKGGPHGGGEVTAVSGNTITVQDKGPAANGSTQTITVTGSTIYVVGSGSGVAKGSPSDVQAGVHIHAEGTTDSNGALTALIVRVDSPPTGR